MLLCLVIVCSVNTNAQLSLSDKPTISSDSFYQVLEPEKFTDQANQTLSANNLLGKLVLVNFMFTDCTDICPMQTHELQQLQKRLAPISEHIQLLSLSLNPEQDTPEKLKQFADRRHVDLSNWTFATSDKKKINSLIKQLMLIDPNIQNASFQNHMTSIWLLNRSGKIMQRYPGAPVSLDRIEREVQNLYQPTMTQSSN